MKTLHMSEAIAVFNALKHEKISERVANEHLGPMGATSIQVWTSVLGGTLQMETANGGCTLVIKPCRAAMLQGAEPVTTANKLREGVAAIRNSGIAIDAEKIKAERDALNSPAIPEGWVACSERMPEKYDFDIWVFSPSRGVIDGLQWDGSMFADDEYQFTIHDATHWMRKIYPAGPTEQPARAAYEIERFGIFSVTELSDGLNFRIEQFHFEHENHIESFVPKFALQAIINRLQEHCDGMSSECSIDVLSGLAAPQQEVLYTCPECGEQSYEDMGYGILRCCDCGERFTKTTGAAPAKDGE